MLWGQVMSLSCQMPGGSSRGESAGKKLPSGRRCRSGARKWIRQNNAAGLRITGRPVVTGINWPAGRALPNDCGLAGQALRTRARGGRLARGRRDLSGSASLSSIRVRCGACRRRGGNSKRWPGRRGRQSTISSRRVVVGAHACGLTHAGLADGLAGSGVADRRSISASPWHAPMP